MILELALHSLRHRPLRTTLTAAGIAIAVGSMVVFLSLGEGLRLANRLPQLEESLVEGLAFPLPVASGLMMASVRLMSAPRCRWV